MAKLQTGIQVKVKYCPNCKGDIRPIPSKKKKNDSHKYKCDVCKTEYEVNVIE